MEILFEDDDCILINKPAGVLSIPDRFDRTIPNVLDLLQKQYEKIWIVHRIDKQTSGVMIVAKNAESHQVLNRQFETHSVRKIYLTLVSGIVSSSSGTIDLPIAEHPSNPGTVCIDSKGKPSITHYKVLETFRSYTLVEAAPETGRLHQIRIHFKAIGHPLAVDEIYGEQNEIYLSTLKKDYKTKIGEIEKPLMSRLTLHAQSITFEHPRRHSMQTIDAPLPKDFNSLLKQLRKHGSSSS